jgi:chromosome segregation ATPase
VIQSALVFLLGFLCAAFLILLAAPLFWRRAQYLWQKQMAAQLPLSLTEIEADRDMLRAAHAVELRKAEMQTAAMREKHTQALLKISTDRSELEKIEPLQQELDVFRIQQQDDRQQLNTLQSSLKKLQEKQASVTEDYEREKRHNEALSQLSDTLRTEVKQRDNEADRLRREAGDLRQDKKQLNSANSELASQVTALKTSLESEKHRNQALEEKLHRLITELSDTQEKLERQSKSRSDDNTSRTLSDQDNKLRETISDLAAEMVARTVAQEGEKSPIPELLKEKPAAETKTPAPARKKKKSKSLAGRIKDVSA